MPRRQQSIEIFAPDMGIHTELPSNLLDIRSSPDLRDAAVYYGVVQKEYGTTLYATGTTSILGAPINHLFEAQFPNASVLQVFTHTNVNKYTTGSDSFVSDGQVFTGTLTDYWSSLMFDDKFIYCNGLNPIQIKSSIAATGTNMISAVATNTYLAWQLAALREHLCLYHTIENGAEFAKRIRWTKKAPLAYSAGTTDFASGTAGAVDLTDLEGILRSVAPLGAGIAIYGDDSIHVQFWVGGSEVFRFQKMVSGVGTLSRRGVASYKDVNYIISRDNFHAYHGGDDIRDIGDSVRRLAFGNINNSAIQNAFVEVDPIEERILFHVPTTGDLTDTVWVYKIREESWTKLVRSYSAYGRFSRVTGLTIGELVGDIGNQNFTFGSAFIDAESQIRLWGDQSGRVVKEDRTVFSVSSGGVSYPQIFEYMTPDLTGHQSVDPLNRDKTNFTTVDKRWLQYNVELVGNGSGYITYSIDGGSTFTALPESPVTLSPSGTTHTLDISERTEQIRFKISNTATNEWVGVRYQRVEFLPGSENK